MEIEITREQLRMLDDFKELNFIGKIRVLTELDWLKDYYDKEVKQNDK